MSTILSKLGPMFESLGGPWLWIHLGYVGTLKTTLAMNLAYEMAIGRHENVLFASLEASEGQMRDMLYVIHSGHRKFEEERKGRGLEHGLDYNWFRRGIPTEHERSFVYECVAPDFHESNDEYGNIYRVDSAYNVRSIADKAKRCHRRGSISTILIDGASILAVSSQSGDFMKREEQRTRELKRLSREFCGGRGVNVVAFEQLSMRDYERVQDQEEKRYRLDRIGSAEAVRMADVLTAGSVGKDKNRLLVQGLKSLDGPLCDVELEVDHPSKTLRVVEEL